MKKIAVFIVLFMLVCPVVSADELDSAMDMWGTEQNDANFTGQKMITDEQFDKTVDKLKQKERDKKRKKWWQKKAPEIKPLCPVPETQNMFQSSELDNIKSTMNIMPTVMIPAKVVASTGETLEPGFYKMSYSNEYGINYLTLAQDSKVTYKIPAQNSQVEEKPNALNYGEAITYSDCIKLIYGNMDISIEAYLHIKN